MPNLPTQPATHCSNCSLPINTKEVLYITYSDPPKIVAAICETCTTGVNICKVAVRRTAAQLFEYYGYAPVEAIKPPRDVR